MARRGQSRKVRVTATLPSDMVRALDLTTKRRGLPSRSRALEVALTHWLRETRRREIEREVEAYYRSLTATEKREDREWAQFASRSNRRLWD
jgi:metal-responsive CopG/Arc/MetJ family transcriptional regulator